MIFFINLIISIIYSKGIGELYKNRPMTLGGYIILFFPLLAIWLIISSTQYYVGTDYGSYMEIFQGQKLDRYEIGFLTILRGFFAIGVKGQIFYLIFYTISFFLLICIFKEFDNNIRYVFFLIIIYICVSNLFNNQLNGLRQAVATYLGSLGFIFFLKKRITLFWLLYLLAISIHLASIVYIVVLMTPIIYKLMKQQLYLLIVIGIILSFTLNINLFYLITDYLPQNYANHITYNFIENRSLNSMVLKYILIPIYILAISRCNYCNFTPFEKKLFNWGIIGFSMKLGLLGLPIISRVSDYFILLSMYPLYCLFKSLAQKNKHILLVSIISFLISLYFFKTIVFPSAEYTYHSIIKYLF